jgi:hypothetical protein
VDEVEFTDPEERELAAIKQLHVGLARNVDAALKHIAELQTGRSTRPPLAFVHIPKTAGGTVSSMLAAARPDDGLLNAGNWITNPEQADTKVRTARLGGGRVLVGHVPYGVYRRHLPPQTQYMTFLREPVDRVLSHYYRHIHIHRSNPARRPRRATNPAMGEGAKAYSLEEAIVANRMPQLNNLATRLLCDDPSPVTLPPDALDQAKANLRAFLFVGLQDRFWESIALLQRTLGLELSPAQEDRHVSHRRPAAAEIAADDRALIEEHNRLDTELYLAGRELFVEAGLEADDDVGADAEELHQLAEAANAEHRADLDRAREWLEDWRPQGETIEELRARALAAGVSDRAFRHVAKQVGVKSLLRRSAKGARAGRRAERAQ